jgi:hypothetical protein
MKGRIFGATMLVIVLVVVLTASASAGRKPLPECSYNVGSWSYTYKASSGGWTVQAKDITWEGCANVASIDAGIYAANQGDLDGSNDRFYLAENFPVKGTRISKVQFGTYAFLDPQPTGPCSFYGELHFLGPGGSGSVPLATVKDPSPPDTVATQCVF